MTIGQSAPALWNTYGAASIAFLGFLFHGLLAYGAAQRTAGQREQQWQSDQEWRKKHSSEANLRDVAIAALHAMANSNEATVKGIQRQLVLIQTELQTLRARAMRAASAEAPRKPNNSAK
jgi:hypothetical protein